MKQIIITLTLLGILISFGYAEELPIRILNDEPIILDEPVSLRSTPNLITGCCEIISYWGILGYYWRIPNDFTDDFYNQRFTPNLPGWLSNVSIIVYEPGSIDVSGLGIDVIVWDDDGTGLPGNELARINVPASEIIYYPDWTIVDFSSLNLNFYNDFHIGYTVVDKVNDTYSILSDKGNSGSMRSSVWWNGSWYYIFEHHNIDVNFIIKAELCHFPFHILSVSPAQNTLDVPVNTDISVNFCTDMLSSSINNTTFKVYGRSSGFHQGTISYDNEPQALTATFDPLEDFQVGDVVTVTLTPGMYTHAGDLITTSYSWSFTIETAGGTENFLPHSTYPVISISTPKSIIAADFNNDEYPDLVTSNWTNKVSVLMNNGDGTFAPYLEYVVGGLNYSVFAADFNNDGYIDITSANSNNTISILLNNGDGTFSNRLDYDVGNDCRSVFSADLDGDGTLDIITANYSSNNISVLLNDGSGAFPSHVDYAVIESPRAVYAADFDKDGNLDIATANLSSGDVSVLLNDGSGTFTLHSTYPVDIEPESIIAADLNSDGNLDIITANRSTHNISVLINNSNGTFAPYQTYDVGNAPQSVFAADFDSDGNLDLITTNLVDDDVSLLLNYGNGTFTEISVALVGNGPYSVCAADFNGDGRIDAATVNYYSADVSILLNQCCLGISGNVDGSPDDLIDIADIVYFIDYSFNLPPGPEPPCMAEADVNGDSVIDIEDIVYLIDYAFNLPSGPEPVECL